MKDWQKVEAVLFGSGKYLTEDQITELSGINSKKSLKNALLELKKHYDKIDSSLDVFNENGSWKLNVKENFSHIVKNVISEAEMPRPVMETLAIIAYKSPVLQSEVIDTRGSGAYEHVSLLEEKGFITKEKFGRSYKLRVSPKFFDYFDIEGDKKLRALFKDVKKPETTGPLDVYEMKEEEKDNAFSDKILERMKKVDEQPSESEEKRKFLDDFDRKFVMTKSNIDATDKEMNEFRKINQTGAPQAENLDEIGVVLKKFNDAVQELESNNSSEEKESEDKEDVRESGEKQVEDILEEKEPEEVLEDISKIPVLPLQQDNAKTGSASGKKSSIPKSKTKKEIPQAKKKENKGKQKSSKKK